MNIINNFLNQVNLSPEKTALICSGKEFSYFDLAENIRKLSANLSSLGVTSGARIAVLLHNSCEYAYVMMAASDLGATLVPLSPSLKPDAINTAFLSSDVEYVIGWHSILKTLIEAREKRFPLAKDRCISVGGAVPGCISFEELISSENNAYKLGKNSFPDSQEYILTATSGSTGSPKPIVFTQETKVRRSMAAKDLYGLSAKDIILTSTPIYHSLAQRLVLLPLMIGGTAVIMTGFTPRKWLMDVEKYNVTFTIAVSSQLGNILKELKNTDFNLKSLHTLVSSSALLKDEIKRKLIDCMDCDVHECYGASEIGIATNLSPMDAENKLDTVGNACPGVQIRIFNDIKQPAQMGEIGEIACKTPMAFAGYYKKRQTTKECFIDGYFLTGDLGKLDAEGFLHFEGRKKDIIITGAINVYPKDIEEVLLRVDGIQEASVIGIDDPHFGEAILAVIVASEKIDEKELRRYCAKHLSDYQQPMAYEFVKELPRNGMGKVIKPELKKQFHGYDATAAVRKIFSTRNQNG